MSKGRLRTPIGSLVPAPSGGGLESERSTEQLTHVPIAQPSVPDFDELRPLLESIWESGWFTNHGAVHDCLERALEARLNWPDTVLTASGTLALQLALAAHRFPPGGEVIVPAFTFPATIQAIYRAGLRPVYGDIDPVRLTLDPRHAAGRVTAATCAVLPVHTFGRPADVEAFETLSRRHGIPVIYDGAAAVGVKTAGRAIADFGAASAFSFHATKVFTTIEGGAVASPQAAIVEAVRSLRNFSLADRSCLEWGTNAKLSEVHAAVGLLNLERLGELIRRRASVVRWYEEALGPVASIAIPPPLPNTKPNHTYFVIQVDPEKAGMTADALRDHLATRGIESRRYFGPEFLFPDANLDALPATRRAAEQLLCLPLFATMGKPLVQRVCACICKAVQGPRREGQSRA